MTASTSTLGIDFGTCRSSAAVLIGSEPHSVVLSSEQTHDMPTSIYVDPAGKILVGEEAAGARIRDSTRYRDKFKLSLGSDRGVSVAVGGANRTYGWVELVAEVLRRCRVRAETQFNNGHALTDVILTVPALYVDGGPEWTVMLQAARAAGFTSVQIAREPHAAAIYYDHVLRRAGMALDPEGQITLVYDLGGGTFDPTLIRRRVHSYELVGAGAYDGGVKCGGIWFDEQIRGDFARKCPETWERLRPSQDRAAVRDEGFARRRAKDVRDLEAFLITVKHRFASPDVSEVNEPEPINGRDYRLTRAEFYTLIEPLLDRTIDCCRVLVQRASVAWRDIARIIMVGGSCHIPLVRDKLEALVRSEGARAEICWQRIGQTDRLVDPHLAVSLGAALVRERPAGDPPERVARDVAAAVQPPRPPAPRPAPLPAPPAPRPAPLLTPRPKSPPPVLLAEPRMKRCRVCSAMLDSRAELCPRCHSFQAPGDQPPPGSLVRHQRTPLVRSTKDRTTAGVLALVLGGLGAHKFYLGRTGVGFLYLLFCWTFIPTVIGFFEAIHLLTMSDQTFAQRHG